MIEYELRKPHNYLHVLNLCLCIAAQFSDFKEKIHKLFPVVYDTKFLSYELKKILKKEGMITCTLCCALP
jgi:hypothetical protein